MSFRLRFELLTKYMRFDLTSTRQRRRQVTIQVCTNGKCVRFVAAAAIAALTYVTLDMTVVSFRGRCSFKQYTPSKAAKYGLKFWCLCDASTAYCLRHTLVLTTVQFVQLVLERRYAIKGYCNCSSYFFKYSHIDLVCK